MVRWSTWSPYSHVDIVLESGQLLGATPEHGVAIRPPVPGRRTTRLQATAPYVPVVEAMQSQLDRPYDWRGIFGCAARQNWQAPNAWFCSELIAWAFEQAGHPLLPTRRTARVTPRDLLLSPRLQPVDSA